jgi:predicted PurR-regulated permease PerM
MKRIWILLAAVALVFLLATCSLFTSTKSIGDTVNQFLADLNSSDRSSVYTNLDPNASLYNSAKAAVYWNALFPKGEVYKLAGITPIANTVTTTLSSTTTYASGYQIVFVMVQDSSKNYLISSITIPTYSIPTIFM